MKKSSILFGVIFSLILGFSNVFAQDSAVSKIKPKTSPEINTVTKTKKVVTSETIEADLAEALTLIESNHFNGKSLDYNDLFKSSIDSMLHTLDPHSSFFDPRDYTTLREDQRGHYYGVGMSVAERNHMTVVIAPFPGSPAYRAGIRPGDNILEVMERVTKFYEAVKA